MSAYPRVWPAPPEWSNPVTETLDWLSDVMQSTATGDVQVRSLRASPRRTFAWTALIDADDRRVVDVFRREIGVQQFLLPVYPDQQALVAPLAAGASGVNCDTDGYDFVVGGSAVLWRDAQHFETVTIDSIAAGALVFAAATVDAWGIGDRIIPLRKARLAQAPQETQLSDDASTLDVTATVDEPCTWPAAWPSATTYRGLPVLDWRGDESGGPTDEYDRLSDTVDTDTGRVHYFDEPDMPLRSQSQDFTLFGRADHTQFRALAYQLAGRVGTCWVPDWQSSLRLAASVSSAATSLTVGWLGLTAFGGPLPNRRDIRIELNSGAVIYRRITGSTDGTDTETLTLDSAVGAAFGPGDVRCINMMSVCAMASDSVQIEHDTDANGVGVSKLAWQALSNDV